MSVAVCIALPACSGLPRRQHTHSIASAGAPIAVPPASPRRCLGRRIGSGHSLGGAPSPPAGLLEGAAARVVTAETVRVPASPSRHSQPTPEAVVTYWPYLLNTRILPPRCGGCRWQI